MRHRIATKRTTTVALLASAMSCTAMLAGTTANMDGTITSSSIAPQAMGGGFGPGWHFQLNLNYVGGMNELTDSIEDRNPLYDIDVLLPVGVAFNPYYEFASGLAVGMEVGPIIIGIGDADFYVIPVGLDLRYTFNREGQVSPFVRAGVQYAFAGGDFIDTGDVGFYAKAGLEIGHSNRWSWGIEAGYSSTSVDVLGGEGLPTEQVEPYEFTIGLFARF